ncbi:hypothetical protein SLS56_004932 [Neofusicoccum ribis]|uniref:Alpha/beta hydrolase fold-3 domain-containing protein n=1 Tax=Neofusicoccum ribis TaxID=45134 RepID=A0ABR3SV08_9PEZI
MGRENQWDPEFAAMWPQLESKMAMVERMPVETLRLAGKQPRPLPDGTPTAYGTICLNISVGDDSTIELKLYIPSTVEMNRPFILMMHSGGKALTESDELAYASPILSESLQGLPSTFILTCGLDPLHDDGVFYADLLKNADIHVLLKEFNGLPHDFYSILPGIQASKRAKQDIINWAKVILQK